MLQPTVEDAIAYPYEVCLAMSLTILQGVEPVQEHPAAEAYLHMIYRQAVVDAQTVAGMILQYILVNIRFAQIVCQLALHLLCGIQRRYRLRAQLVETIVPRLSNESPVVVGLHTAYLPSHGHALSCLQLRKGAYRVGERQLASIPSRRLHVGISERQPRLLSLTVDTEIAHRALPREYHLPGGMCCQRIGTACLAPHHRPPLARERVVDTRQRRRQAVLAKRPPLRRVERWCLTGRPQILMIPESGHIEFAVAGREFRLQLCTVVEPHCAVLCRDRHLVDSRHRRIARLHESFLHHDREVLSLRRSKVIPHCRVARLFHAYITLYPR